MDIKSLLIQSKIDQNKNNKVYKDIITNNPPKDLGMEINSQYLQNYLGQDEVIISEQNKKRTSTSRVNKNIISQKFQEQSHQMFQNRESLLINRAQNEFVTIKDIKKYQQKQRKKQPSNNTTGGGNNQQQRQRKNNINQQISENSFTKTTIEAYNVPFVFKNIETDYNRVSNISSRPLSMRMHDQVSSQCSNSNSRFSDFRSLQPTQKKVEKSSKIQHRKNNNTTKNKNNIQSKTSSNIFKQLAENKFYLDVVQNMNVFQYQLKMTLKLEIYRGIQISLISAKEKSQNSFIDSSFGSFSPWTPPPSYYKLQIMKLPPNIIRVRVYLLISSKNKQTKKQEQKYKIWKELSIPCMQSKQTLSKSEKQLKFIENLREIDVQIISYSLSFMKVIINHSIEFNINMDHPKICPTFYYFQIDPSGAYICHMDMIGKENPNMSEYNGLFPESGCQNNCQII